MKIICKFLMPARLSGKRAGSEITCADGVSTYICAREGTKS